MGYVASYNEVPAPPPVDEEDDARADRPARRPPGRSPAAASGSRSWIPDATFGHDKPSSVARTAKQMDRLRDLQDRLWAESKHAVLVVLQGIDAAGKDGTIAKVMDAFDPQGCPVTSFKVPSAEELAHDYLWRVHQRTPAKGEIGIFNRSHYEDVLVVRVHDLVPRRVWSKRYDQINDFERTLAESGTTIVKFFLNIDRDEQRQRFQERYDDPRKRWKFRDRRPRGAEALGRATRPRSTRR